MSSNASQPTASWPEFQTGPLIVGGVLIGVGAVLALAGAAIAGSQVVSATRRWMRDLEVPPSQVAKLKWEQAKTAAATGAASWREHPSAHVHLLRRAAADES
ncbi:MAG: hypothetical protein ACLQDY_18400 [Streptosporangiaceae bacterium]